MAKSSFAYVTYIRTTPEKLWSALTDTEIIKQYWFGVRCESQWTAGSLWKLVYPDGRNTDNGEIVEVEPPRRLVIRWEHQDKPELKAEGESICTMELLSCGPAVKFSITHTIECESSKLIAAVSGAWPMVISNLKSLLESGAIVLETPDVAGLEKAAGEMKNENSKDFCLSLTVKTSAKETLKKISQVNLWWAKNFKGQARKVNDEFSVCFGATYVNFRISDVVPDKKITWLVTDCNLHWIKNKKEWKNTEVIWSLTEKSGKTQIDFIHRGLTPRSECYEDCKPGWTHHLKDSLFKLLEKGEGFPE